MAGDLMGCSHRGVALANHNYGARRATHGHGDGFAKAVEMARLGAVAQIVLVAATNTTRENRLQTVNFLSGVTDRHKQSLFTDNTDLPGVGVDYLPTPNSQSVSAH